jgi:peptide/nickel transport system substrate-binding protein
MQKKVLYGLLVIFMTIAVILSSCGKKTTSSTTIATTTSNPSTTSTNTTTATQAHWWDKWGAPQYGGTINIQLTTIRANFDTYGFFPGDWHMPYESLLAQDNAVIDRAEYSYSADFVPQRYFSGQLAEKWELTDPTTMTFHLRQGVKWQNKPPVNGREFVADDVVAHYNRVLFSSTPSVMYVAWLSLLQSVTATDKYTVVYKFKAPGVVPVWQVSDQVPMNLIEAPEYAALYQPPATTETPGGPPGGGEGGGGPPPGGPPIFGSGGPLQDWHNIVGTGAWMISDFITNSSETLVKNPDYWGYDERFPKNKLPYADTLKALIIPDLSTAMAAFRTGKVDMLGGVGGPSAMDKKSVDVLKNDVDGLQIFELPPVYSPALSMRNDLAPFSDIKVRQALNMAIDRPGIAKGYYKYADTPKPAGVFSPVYKGWVYAYEDWPQSLKDVYSFNPQKAKQLLTDAGYPNGFKTNVVAASNSDLELLQVLKAQLLDVSIDMEIKSMDPTTFGAITMAKKTDGLIFAGGTGTPKFANAIWRYHSKNDTLNTDAINSPEYDANVEKFNNAMTEDEAAAATVAADKVALENSFTVWVFPISTYVITQPYIKGYAGEAIMWNHWYYDTARWWIDKSLKK